LAVLSEKKRPPFFYLTDTRTEIVWCRDRKERKVVIFCEKKKTQKKKKKHCKILRKGKGQANTYEAAEVEWKMQYQMKGGVGKRVNNSDSLRHT